MGDRVTVQIEIGGDLPADKLAALVTALEEDGFHLGIGDQPVTGDDLREAAQDGHAVALEAFEVNYADTGNLEAVLKASGLRYRKTWEAGGGFGPGGSLDGEDFAAIDGEPMLSPDMIRKLGSFEAVNAHIARLTADLPPFRIVGESAERGATPDEPTRDYRVRWEYLVHAATPEEAARLALARMGEPINLDDECSPSVFEVTPDREPSALWERVDLAEITANA